MNNQTDHDNKFAGKAPLLLAIIVLGSICGLIEVVLGIFLKQVDFVWNAGLLTGLGLGMIAIGYAIFKKPFMAIGIALVAVLCKQLVVPVLGETVMCKMNSCVAVILEYGAFAVIAGITMKRMQAKTKWRWLSGGMAALGGSLAFYFAGMHIAPCNYLLSFNSFAGFFSFLYKESLSWTIFSAVFVPLGWYVGEKLKAKITALSTDKPVRLYAIASGMALICWVLSAIAIAQSA